ncbi:thioesterase family protein [Nocardia sp. CA-119907]|uniref:thioesterase family protein n=1 Tax=Nocardia sp. CA-119907 TaxID=3239973 RepID=UPI003D999581
MTHRETMIVDERHTVPYVAPEWRGFADMPPVFATAMMIGFIEQTCVTALRPYLSDGQRTVGTHVDVSHVAATPQAMTVTATVTLTEFDGRNLRFDVSCHDESGLIGAGTHCRAVVDLDTFMRRVADKAAHSRARTP